MSNIPIFLSSDNNYAPFVATTIASICDNTKSFCDFYILDGGISQENQEKIEKLKDKFSNFSLEFIKIDIEKYFKNAKITEKFPSSIMYARYIIPFLKPQIDRAIYSDVDVIVMGDITDMYNENLDNYALGAVWSGYNHTTKSDRERKSRLNISETHKWFHSGNLLFDCKKWREDNIFNKLADILSDSDTELKYPDEEILNIYFQNNYKILDNKYCFVSLLGPSNNIVIRHFACTPKPWLADFYIYHSKPEPIYDREVFWKYAKMTEFYDVLLNKRKEYEKKNKYCKIFNAMVNKKDNLGSKSVQNEIKECFNA